MDKKKVVFNWHGIDYPLVFNLNVMERIQEEYGSVNAWGDLTDKDKGEPNAKAVIFGICEMINEGIDIENEENVNTTGYVKKEFLTIKQVGRLITDVGLSEATSRLNKTVTDSIHSDEKNS